MNTQQIQKGVVDFVENEIAQKATGIRKFGVYFFIPSVTQMVSNYLTKLKSIMPHMFDGENLKLDTVYSYAKNAIQKTGQFEFVGLIFNESDIDKLYSYIKGVTL